MSSSGHSPTHIGRSSRGRGATARPPTPGLPSTTLYVPELASENNVDQHYDQWLSNDFFLSQPAEQDNVFQLLPHSSTDAFLNPNDLHHVSEPVSPADWLNGLSALNTIPINQRPTDRDIASDPADYSAPDDSSTAVSSASVAWSHSSVDSAGSRSSSALPKFNKRRRRRRRPTASSLKPSRTFVVRRYQCTFCTDSFKTKYDWQRHEATIHLSLERWECAKSGPFKQDADGTVSCVFCGLREPMLNHMMEHRYSTCLTKPREERIFHRKDHLRQHLRIAHNGCTFNEKMESWFSSVDLVNSRCGFCDARMETWTDRQRHLGLHFKHGADMKDWKGDRGFDEDIEKLVENDMPVFMIADQRNTMEPFSGSHVGHQTEPNSTILPEMMTGTRPSEHISIHSPDVEAQSLSGQLPVSGTHSYREVETLLLAYVREELSQGRVPCDEQLRRKTSEIVFGPDNTWDQTWADNPLWLEMFKQKAGLISLPLTRGKNAFIGSDAV